MNEKEKLSGIENYLKELFPDVLLRTRGIPNLLDSVHPRVQNRHNGCPIQK